MTHYIVLGLLLVAGVLNIAFVVFARSTRRNAAKIEFSGSTAHWVRPPKVQHGPQEWPWWRLMSWCFCRLQVVRPSTGWRLWIYTRWGALFGDVYFIRKNQ